MRSLRACALVLVVSSCWVTGVARADTGAAALLPFQGPQSAKVRQDVQSGLRKANVELVPLKQVSAVAKKTKGYAKQAARLDASVLVRTRVRRVEGRWIADTEVRNAKGQRVRRLKSNSSNLGRLSSRLVAQLLKTGLMPTAAAAAAAPATPTPAPKASPDPPKQPRVVVRPFDGTQASKVRSAAARGLRGERIELYPNADFVEKAQSLGVNLRSEGGHVAPAAALAVSALFEGDVLREEGVWSAYVRLVDGQSSTVVRQRYYEADTLNALLESIESGVGPDFRKDLGRLEVRKPGAVVVAPTAAVVEPPKKKEPKKNQSKARRDPKRRPAAVDIQADFRIVHRKFRYNDILLPQDRPPSEGGTELRDYRLGAGPGVGLKFQYFPGAHFTSGVGAQFGIDFEWERLFAIDSTRSEPDGTVSTFPTESQQFLVGLRWRYPVGRWEPFVVLNYGFHNFQFGVSGPPVPGEDTTAGVPGVRYQFARFGAGFRVVLGEHDTFIIAGNIALRFVGDRVGGIGSPTWFPEARANGLDTGVSFGVALPLGFEIRIGVDYRRYWFDLNPSPGSTPPPRVAGGALDTYVAGTFGFAWRR